MAMTQNDLNWDHVKSSLDELSKEIADVPKLNLNENIQDLWSGIRNCLTNVIDYNHDGWPAQEIFVSHDGSPQGIPPELARVVVDILSFCRRMDIDLADNIKTLVTGKVV